MDIQISLNKTPFYLAFPEEQRVIPLSLCSHPCCGVLIRRNRLLYIPIVTEVK